MCGSAKAPTTFNNTGVYDAEVPPVLIPNTEVKLSSAESTWLDTAWEDMSMPVPKKKAIRNSVSLFLWKVGDDIILPKPWGTCLKIMCSEWQICSFFTFSI